MDDQLFPIIKSFLGQMDSAMKVSDLLAKHSSSDEITVDHLITGLVYRLMVPMTNEEISECLNSAEQILDKIEQTDSDSDSDSDYDNLSECYDNIAFAKILCYGKYLSGISLQSRTKRTGFGNSCS